MKHLLSLLCALGLTLGLYAAVPQGFTYQSVVRNASNDLLTNHSISVRISILQGTESGSAVYQETHHTSTNANGLATLVIGQGTNLSPAKTFAAIDWSQGVYFLKAEIDPNGGTDYTISTCQQLMSVPYAMYAFSAGTQGSGTELAQLQARIDALEGVVVAKIQVKANGQELPHDGEYYYTSAERVGDQFQLSIETSPYKNVPVKWELIEPEEGSRMGQATLQNGLLTITEYGSAQVYFEAGTKSGYVGVEMPYLYLHLDKTQCYLAQTGDIAKLTPVFRRSYYPSDSVVYTPEDINQTITWSSSDPSVVSVDNGYITAVTKGSATITAKASYCTATCQVTVGVAPGDVVAVIGEATGFAGYDDKLRMAQGINEVTMSVRDGMYEKYIVLEAGKEFSFSVNGVPYGATLSATSIATDNEYIDGYKGALVENSTCTVNETALYHVALDLNQDGLLDNAGGKQVILVPVEWGVAGAMNSWGYTAATTSPTVVAGAQTLTYTWKDQEIVYDNSEFKFKHNFCWKINMDSYEQVKANANLGTDSQPSGDNIVVETAGMYDITLTFTLAGGDIKNSFAYTPTCTKKIFTTMYMIGAAWGNWDWTSAGVVEMIPVHSHPGMYWCTRYFKASDPFKFCAQREWIGDFYGRATNNGLGTVWTQVDNSCRVLADGLYTVIIDTKADAMTIKPAAIYGIGNAFDSWYGWDEGQYPFTVNADGTASVTTYSYGNLRIYSDIDNPGNWWQSEFNVFSGSIVYRGTGDEPEAVPVSAGQTVTLDFNAGTGSIK